MKYSFLKGLSKSATQAAIFAIPLLLMSLPNEWTELTIGGLLTLVVNYLKVKYQEAS